MTYIEMLLLVQQSGDKILEQGINTLFTQHHRYIRQLDATEWQEDMEPGLPEMHHGRGGAYHIWKRDET